MDLSAETAGPEPCPASSTNAANAAPPPSLAGWLDALRYGMDQLRFDGLFDRWLDGLDTRETLTALAGLRCAGNLDANLADSLRARLIRHLCETDIDVARGEIDALPPGDARTLALGNLAALWVDQQLDAATAWASQMEPGDERDQVLFAVASEAMRTQPAEALRLADELPANPSRDELVRRAVGEWALNDPSAAISWARSIADDALARMCSRRRRRSGASATRRRPGWLRPGISATPSPRKAGSDHKLWPESKADYLPTERYHSTIVASSALPYHEDSFTEENCLMTSV